MLSRLASLQQRALTTLHTNPIFNIDSASISSTGSDEGNRLLNEDSYGEGITTPELRRAMCGSMPDLEEAFKIVTRDDEIVDTGRLDTNKRGNDSTAKWRHGPVPCGEQTTHELKLTTLTGLHDDDKIYANKEHNESTVSLLNYFAYLGTTNDYGKIDYDFIENVIHQADINVKDTHGQSLFHEVAREWSTDLAFFMKQRGAKIDEPDHYGRTPLFIASAANHTEMVKWLLDNGADVNHTTNEEEGQSAIHYAANYGSLQVFRLLLEQGVSPVIKDSRGRTSFFVAAFNGQEEMCKVMLDMDLPTACYSNNGVATIDLIIRNLPNALADRALNQFITVDTVNRTEYYYISCMEKGRWLRLTRPLENMKIQSSKASTIHEILVETEDLQLIQHPAVEKLLALKYKRYGQKYINGNIAITLLYTLIWTIAAITAGHGPDGELLSKHTAACFSIIGFIMTLYFTYQMFLRYKVDKETLKNRQLFVAVDINKERRTNHPQWKFEEISLKKQLEIVNNLKNRFWMDGWNIVELLCLSMAFVESFAILTEVFLFHFNTQVEITDYYTAFFVIILWLRLNRCLRCISNIGPLIAMLGQCVLATTQFGFLYFEFYIPLCAAVWVTFGGVRKGFEDSSYQTLKDMFYQIYLMSIIGDYDADTLMKEDHIFAAIYVFLIIFMLGLVSLNLYIALLSEGVSRVNCVAIANTQLMKAKELLFYEKINPELKLKFEKYINKHCAPLMVDGDFHSKHRDRLHHVVRKLEKSKEFVSKGLKDYLNQMIAICKEIERTNKSILQFQQSYSTNTTKKLKSELEAVK